jgi:hypothetical protein
MTFLFDLSECGQGTFSDSFKQIRMAKGPGPKWIEPLPVNDLSQLLALLRKLTHTDGKETLEESRWLRRLVSELPPETDANQDYDPEKFKSLVEDEGDSEELLRVMLTLSLADGQTSTGEWQLIQQTAKLLNYPAEQLEELRSETVLLKDPY